MTAVATADRYFERFPEDLERYGEAGRARELHDAGAVAERLRAPAVTVRGR